VNRYDVLNRNMIVWNKDRKRVTALSALGWGPVGSTFRQVVIKAVGGYSTDLSGNLAIEESESFRFSFRDRPGQWTTYRIRRRGSECLLFQTGKLSRLVRVDADAAIHHRWRHYLESRSCRWHKESRQRQSVDVRNSKPRW
jgi:hypothetical protein